MQNVLVDDRRIWVDLCVAYFFHYRARIHTIFTALSPSRASTTANGPMTPRWVHARAAAALAGAMTSRRLGGTAQVVAATAATTTWFSMCPTINPANGGVGAGVHDGIETKTETIRGGGHPRETIIATERGGGAGVGTGMTGIGIGIGIGIGGGGSPDTPTTWKVRIYRIYYTYCREDALERLGRVGLHGRSHIGTNDSSQYTN